MKQQPEFALQKLVTEYLRLQYPNVLFLSDARAFLKLTIPQALRSKSVQKPDFACPDLMVFEARKNFHGLFIELKKESPFKKDGALKKDVHLSAQQDAQDVLRVKGYCTSFEWDFDTIKTLLDWYLK